MNHVRNHGINFSTPSVLNRRTLYIGGSQDLENNDISIIQSPNLHSTPKVSNAFQAGTDTDDECK